MKLTDLLTKVCCLTALLGFIYPDVLAFQIPVNADSTVKIGLLIQDNKALAAKYGAEMAIRKANETGGFKGKNFQLVIRSMEGPWGTGSKQAVDLIFQENVCAIMGSHDGRNAHLVEQVSAKARIVFLSAWASDPTLSQAFVPWFFSCIPNDLQQADAFIEEIFNKRKITKTATVSDNDYDSKLALHSFLKRIKVYGKTDPLQLFYDNSGQDFNALLDQINKSEIRCIILFGQPEASLRIIKQIHQRKMNQLIFGSLSLLGENGTSGQDLKSYEGVILVSSGNYPGTKDSSFQQDFKGKYGKMPGPVAAYAFDGMNLIIEAIREAGLDRDKIQKSLAKINYEGITGPIQFDDKGKRIGKVNMVEIKNGISVDIGEK
jgi:branched-chain amino acid transport system substrate-binding protein